MHECGGPDPESTISVGQRWHAELRTKVAEAVEGLPFEERHAYAQAVRALALDEGRIFDGPLARAVCLIEVLSRRTKSDEPQAKLVRIGELLVDPRRIVRVWRGHGPAVDKTYIQTALQEEIRVDVRFEDVVAILSAYVR